MIFETEKEAIEWLDKAGLPFRSLRRRFSRKQYGWEFELGEITIYHPNANRECKDEAKSFLEAVNLLANRLTPDKLKP